MKKLAIKLGIKIIWLYSDHGRGCGIVNAMLSFGCKPQLRSEIITNTSWFQSTEQMVKFLKDYFQSDDSKEHFLVDAAETTKIWKQKQGELKIEPCRKFHVIRVNCEGSFGIKVLFLCNNKIAENIYFCDALLSVKTF